MFIFNEDRAVMAKFQNMVVSDDNAPDTGRPVQVTWLDADVELANLVFPAIVISNTGITYDPARAHAGFFQLQYAPEGFAHWAVDTTEVSQSPYYAQTPIPYNINYQIEVLARTNRHASFLTSVLSGPDFLHTRYGYLSISEDGTIRRMDLTSGPERQSIHDSDGKRLFHSVYSINVSTELLPQEIESYSKVQTVIQDITLIPPTV
jgi:hypothetical protein